MSDSSSGSSWFEKLSKLFSDEPESRADLDSFLQEAQAQDLIDKDALLMIQGVLDVSEARVRDVMIPKVQMSCVDEADELDVILENMLDAAHSRYPVLSADTDEVIGILLAKDVLRAVVKHQLTDKSQLEELYRTPVLVSESKRLNVLLREFKNSRNHMALVVDEYGEVAGLVTIEDVLEQIVGDIEDEHDEDDDNIQKHISGAYAVKAITSLDEFNQFFNTTFEDELLETIGGIVAKRLGKIPEEEEVFEIEGLRLTVSKADERRVESFLVEEKSVFDEEKANSENEAQDSEAVADETDQPAEAAESDVSR
ncbi:transporter associated domain-containing protein [Hydrogenovibrio sp. 3SP14C1]|uniref:HlyC/CorC family transporter n=1 Tax=Hydrogenovibrio sp. 3SP14C1 TaxID=3038774 RepID=UPI002416BB5C|nr:transporter associated domain-containing protein [Hydrogenovibrio sp. 3SP14C1]MDG4811711.1 transporter associated domain-containing protein [Hydrogenovibrio sp. 3SP14C1]